METILTVLIALVLLSVLITVHELGHFTAGKLLGFRILEFSVGMGPIALKKNRNGIDFCVRCFPVGGMCRFYGEDEANLNPDCFNAKPAWKRFLVVLAGPFMNLLSAFLICVCIFSFYGSYMPSIYEVSRDLPAEKAGLVSGDVLLSIDGHRIHSYDDAIDLIRNADGLSMEIAVRRGSETRKITVTDFRNEETGGNYIGVTIGSASFRMSVAEALPESAYYIASIFRQTFSFLGGIFRGKASMDDVSGPVGTIAYISMAVRYGLETVLRLSVIISVSLAIMNLLPLPALDGGRLVFILFELVTGKRIPSEKEGLVHFIGLLLLLGLILLITVHDIRGLL